MIGIYKITNKSVNKCYIGESLDIGKRWKQHIKDLSSSKHCNYKLQEDYDRFGIESFTFEIVEVLNNSDKEVINLKMELIYLEDKYIKKYNSITSGYNIEHTLGKILKGEKNINDNPHTKELLEEMIIEKNKYIIKECFNEDYFYFQSYQEVAYRINYDFKDIDICGLHNYCQTVLLNWKRVYSYLKFKNIMLEDKTINIEYEEYFFSHNNCPWITKKGMIYLLNLIKDETDIKFFSKKLVNSLNN